MVAEGENNMWERRSSVSAGPQTDFSHMGQCPGEGRANEVCLGLITPLHRF